ncbi:tannase/feruloyl esterase family alpha/beta hydrolase [Variovorax sp. ZS18.2.2]|uniref:tannase/feruloyl esterase family alpha/beta hydrolase n=1 Tax=Variovorax sp. ZS18.2.2 TaxID=2971255 RepID=UPI002150E774|nr:tannase/feruloyl esterase family alpha/beta hydrolase [Variovorax sp. ZS18.2.2]MCR6476120.1 tannase/feruloyl esterase family alpha/beta hydrolase [Variovorax sp. ZS18.2.2]
MKSFQLACGLLLASSLYPMLSHANQATMNRAQCDQFKSATIAANEIGLPTTGAGIVNAEWKFEGLLGVDSYCKLDGEISPVDPAAPPIKFTANFPMIWNKRALMFGGGGLNGTIPPSNGPFMHSLFVESPLKQRFVTFSSDSGHSSKGLAVTDGSFALNEEALNNFAGDALKKTRDTVAYLINAGYATRPTYWYGIGGSEGGREVLALAHRWPEEWDGIVSWYPAARIADQVRSYAGWSQALAAPGGFLSVNERQVLHESVLATCDGLDGVKDGLVSNPDACRAAFNPKNAKKADGWPLRCIFQSAAGLNEVCLSDSQINTLNVMTSPTSFSTKTVRGDKDFPGVEWNAAFGISKIKDLESGVGAIAGVMGMGFVAPSYPEVTDDFKRLAMAADTQFGDAAFRYFVARNATANILKFNVNDPGPFQSRITALEGLLNMNNSDLTPFFKKGGKIILLQGMSDPVVPLQSTRRYYNDVVSAVNATKPGSASSSIRYYEIPGMGHAAGGDFNGQWDGLAAVQKWVEDGTAPVYPVVWDLLNPLTSRPLCEYPAWPKYVGGNADFFLSFKCATN